MSFAPSTLVLTVTGARVIANLKVGDHVTAYDPQTGTASSQTVEATSIHHDANLVDVTLKVTTPASAKAASTTTAPAERSAAKTSTATTVPTTQTEVMHTTANHPWLSADHGWLIASFLHVCEPVRRADGSVATVVRVQRVPGAADMWDLTVANLHTFAVGTGAFVVHNACGDGAKIDFSDTGAIQHEMKHAPDFGVSDHNNLANRKAFVHAMQRHMEDADTVEIQGYFGSGGRRALATHYYNPNTGLNVFAHADGKLAGKFWGAWRLEAGQSASLLATRGFY